MLIHQLHYKIPEIDLNLDYFIYNRLFKVQIKIKEKNSNTIYNAKH